MKARDNPYRVEQLHKLTFRFRQEDWDSFLKKLAAADFRGAIIGPHGSGKTTLVLELVDRLHSLGLKPNSLRLNLETNPLAAQLVQQWKTAATPDQILVLDGAEQLSYFAWRKLLRSSRAHRGLIVTAHSPVKLPTLYRTQVDPDLLKEIIRELEPDNSFSNKNLATLLEKHRNNLRECLRELYDSRTGAE